MTTNPSIAKYSPFLYRAYIYYTRCVPEYSVNMRSKKRHPFSLLPATYYELLAAAAAAAVLRLPHDDGDDDYEYVRGNRNEVAEATLFQLLQISYLLSNSKCFVPNNGRSAVLKGLFKRL